MIILLNYFIELFMMFIFYVSLYSVYLLLNGNLIMIFLDYFAIVDYYFVVAILAKNFIVVFFIG